MTLPPVVSNPEDRFFDCPQNFWCKPGGAGLHMSQRRSAGAWHPECGSKHRGVPSAGVRPASTRGPSRAARLEVGRRSRRRAGLPSVPSLRGSPTVTIARDRQLSFIEGMERPGRNRSHHLPSGEVQRRHSAEPFATHDIALDDVDFRHLPETDGSYDTVVFDPPYTISGGKSSLALYKNHAGGWYKHDQIVHFTGSGPGGHNIFTVRRARRAHSYLIVFVPGRGEKP